MDTASKVTVEYRDPSGAFPLVSRDVNARLPLRNLNWQSQNRPVRQIKSLHLDFLPDSLTRNTLQPPAPRQDSERSTSFDIVGNGTDQRGKNAVKERRHQIPGLQTSSYLKIYVLRCDDKDTYKSTERAKLREWMRQISASKKNGNHDACEWLILHVVIPDTHAASEPRWRDAAAEDSEEQLKERPKQGAKWPGKSKRTVFDKLRADFNESGKGALDCVAQIKLPKDQFPVDLLPTPAVAGTLKETQEEREKAWNDLISKIRNLTLGSFDQRVKQYEADIAEQESRRSMPGFNFCTFFIYKEGLAKALESVGLIEDTLVIYDELSLGLETVLRERASGKADATATTFAPYTDGIKERIIDEGKSQPNGTNGNDVKNQRSVKDAETIENDYRERIARSSISVFDFFSYLFSRQKAIILRLANAQAARANFGLSTKDDTEDLVLISEVCWRAAAFIHNNARILRQDLLSYRDDKPRTAISDADVESLVSSWSYDMAGKVLEETASYALDHSPEPGRRETPTNGHASSPRSDSSRLSAPSAHPQRTTSLPPRKSRVSELQNRSSLQSASESDLMSRPSSSGTDNERRSISVQPGFAELVTYRAALVMLRRKSLELLAKQRGWVAGWAIVREKQASKVEEVDLNGDSESSPQIGDAHTHTPKNKLASDLLSPALTSALSSEQEFYEAYGHLSDQAMRYYVTSTQTKSAEAIIGDLAILKYQQGNFEYAVSYFQHVLPLYSEDGWSLMEAEGLRMYANCLKEMDRKEEYVKTMLLLLAKICAKRNEKKVLRMKFEVVDDEAPELEGLLSKLVAFSGTLDAEITTPAGRYFSDVQCDREIQRFEDRDGFALRLRLHHLLDEKIELEQVAIRLVSVEDSIQEIWLSHRDPVRLRRGLNQFDLESNAVAFGAYLIDKVVLQVKMLRFEYEFRSKPSLATAPLEITEPVSPLKPSEAYKQPWVYLYPTQHAFNVEVALARNIQLETTRFLEIKLSSGWNDVSNINLKLKPASAGLRLHLADSRTNDIDNRSGEESSTGQIVLGSLKANNSALVQVPYTLEQAGQEILVRLEAWYHTSKGSFVFVTSSKLPTKLPVDVDVRDIFHFDTLFSSFTTRSTSQSPLCITHTALKSSAKYQVAGPPVLPTPMIVFKGQPVRLLYKITRNSFESESTSKRDNALTFSVQYCPVDELLSNALLRAFGDALDQSPFASLSRLLIPLLSLRSKFLLSTADMGMALLLSKATAPSYDEVGWQEVIQTLPSAVRQQLTDWLKMWHNNNTSITLGQDMAEMECSRCITISVDVPQGDFVHKVSLLLPKETKYSKHFPPIFVWGAPIKAQLKFRSTKAWSNRPNIQLENNDSAKDDAGSTKFIFEVQADGDSWLIGGQRRAHFAFQEDRELTFELLLIPLKQGTLSLPNVDVQLDRSVRNTEGSSREIDGPPLTCETHYESAGQVVRVIRDVKAVRVHLAEPHSPGHVRSQSRPSTALTSKEAG